MCSINVSNVTMNFLLTVDKEITNLAEEGFATRSQIRIHMLNSETKLS